jgi:glyoxylase-like metal-dependent hydrolase (beta-lactamase superfamily II)
VFTGETLGLYGPDGVDVSDVSAPDRYSMLASIRAGLFTLSSETVVHPGHGPDTRIGTQRWDRRLWS